MNIMDLSADIGSRFCKGRALLKGVLGTVRTVDLGISDLKDFSYFSESFRAPNVMSMKPIDKCHNGEEHLPEVLKCIVIVLIEQKHVFLVKMCP